MPRTVLSSAMGLQILRARQGHAPSPEAILRANKSRIDAMALVHEALYRADDIGHVDAEAYFRHLLKLIETSYDRRIPVTVTANPIRLNTETTLRLGTILNELYTNTLKHSDEADSKLRVTLALTRSETGCTFTYTQTGHTRPVDPSTFTESHGLGMMLIRLSTQEMGGELRMDESGGALVYEIRFGYHNKDGQASQLSTMH